VRVDGGTVSFHLPVRGDADLLPGTNIEVGLVKIRRAVFRSLHPVKLPHSIKRFCEARCMALAECRLLVRKWRVGSAPGFLVDSVYTRIFPVACRWATSLSRQPGVEGEHTQQQRKHNGFHLGSYL